MSISDTHIPLSVQYPV